MKIKWLGHATFLVTSKNGTTVMTDPYAASPELKYNRIKDSADVITISHDHPDHNNGAEIIGNPQVIRNTKETKGVNFKGILSYHDKFEGKEKGENIIFCFNIDGINICHLGDLGHMLNRAQLAELGKIDILLIPVGNVVTIDIEDVNRLCTQIKPKIIIPMHYKTEKVGFPILDIEEFLKGKDNVTRIESSELEFKGEELPYKTQIMVLKPAN
jgi:L-ascorbate metabolism protein UlaG (beta-lactamase superfamily)